MESNWQRPRAAASGRARVTPVHFGLLVVAVLALAGGLASVARSSPSRWAVQSAPRLPHGARRLRPAADSSVVTGAVALKPRDAAALERFVAEVTDPGSPMFHRYLAPGAFARRFGPAPATIDAIRTALEQSGLHVAGVSSNGLMVRFSGPVSRVEGAFDTELAQYRLSDGAVGRATTEPVTLPASLSGSVVSVVGLNTLVGEQPVERVRPNHRRKGPPPRTAAFAHPPGSPDPCRKASAAATDLGGLTDDQIAHAYGAFGLYAAGDTGAGQHVAVYEDEPFLRSDIRSFDTCYFGAARAAAMMRRLHVHAVDGGQPTGPGSGEAVLDVDDISALAPGATIDVYEGPSANDNPNVYDDLDEYTAIIDADSDQVVSTSWGLCEQAVQSGQPGLQEAENYLFEQAAAQGQTVYAAAGDNGSNDCNVKEGSSVARGQNPLAVDDPASQPYVVGVGGTSITDAATQPAREHVWNDGAGFGAGGGGISMSWEMPSWQQSSSVPGIVGPGSGVYRDAATVERRAGYPSNFCQATLSGASPATPCRLVPDVSAQADNYTGAITTYSESFASPLTPDGWATTGGTSSSTPIWAALTALINASPTCQGQASTRSGIGFASPLLYAVASDPTAYAASFNDIRAGSNDIYGLGGGATFAAARGYDPVSGLGSPRLTDAGGTAGLAYYLCRAASSQARPTVSALTPAIGNVAGGEQIVISGSGFESGGRADVAGLQIGTRRVTSFTVTSPTSITATLPAALATLPPKATAPQDGAGPAEVVVTLDDDQSSSAGASSRFEYVDESSATSGAVPSVTGISPAGGLETATGTVTILGSGFTDATQVSFGGVAAGFRVLSPFRISATWPRYGPSTACSPLPKTGVFSGEDASNDICQVQVQVTNANGTSATGRILPPIEGALVADSSGVIKAPAGCDCETGPAPDEFDYLPQPQITSVSTSEGAAHLASEAGDSVVTIRGRGLDPQALDWATVGNPASELSTDMSYAFASGTELQIVAPRERLTTGEITLPLRVRTLAGQSSPIGITYAGRPSISDVVALDSRVRLHGASGGPDTGGTPIRISGRGLAGQIVDVRFSGAEDESYGTQYSFAVDGGGTLSTSTVQQNPDEVSIRVCTVTACSRELSGDRFYLYPPGAPSVSSVTPRSGPPAGGTEVAIAGENLGCPLSVSFGAAGALKFSPGNTLLACGTTTVIHAKSPAGTAGTTVPVRVQTVAGYFTRARARTSAAFTYTSAQP